VTINSRWINDAALTTTIRPPFGEAAKAETARSISPASDSPIGLAPNGGDLVERLAGPLEEGVPFGVGLPAAHGDVDIERINLEAVSTSCYALGGHDRGAGTHKWVEDNIATAGTITHCVGDERDRLDGWMHDEIVHPSRTKRVLMPA
jgi:hypothetical protein